MVLRRVLSIYQAIIDRLWAASPYIFANCCSVGRSVVPSFRLDLGKPHASPLERRIEIPAVDTIRNAVLQQTAKLSTF